MVRTATIICALLAIFVVPGGSVQSTVPKTGKKEPAKKAEDKPASMTGCIDEQDGKYVLTDDRGLAPVADLEAVGFPTEGFAKHVGHKVTVKGTSIPSGARPVFKVRAIEMVSETCTAGNNSQSK
jgi:hypothetical protein